MEVLEQVFAVCSSILQPGTILKILSWAISVKTTNFEQTPPSTIQTKQIEASIAELHSCTRII